MSMESGSRVVFTTTGTGWASGGRRACGSASRDRHGRRFSAGFLWNRWDILPGRERKVLGTGCS